MSGVVALIVLVFVLRGESFFIL
ncbi:MAG TPA: hypothetical protein ENK68_03380 [Epsilonproteobacteria bacterium]|nr:hypothetical protein [Campylobacterota bacterium]